jgi:hypothetical protein
MLISTSQVLLMSKSKKVTNEYKSNYIEEFRTIQLKLEKLTLLFTM